MRKLGPVLVALIAVSWAAPARADAPRFVVTPLSVDGQVKQVSAVDLDGDGRRELVAVVFKGEGEATERTLAIFWNQEGAFSPQPNLVLPVPADVCAYDWANVDATPGWELVELTPGGVRARGFQGRVAGSPKVLVSEPTVFLRASKRQLPQLPVFHQVVADAGPVMLVPGPGVLGLYRRVDERFERFSRLTAEVGEDLGVPRREGPPVARPGLPAFTVTSRFPQVRVVDLDGDGRLDVALVAEAQVRGFLQRADGTFASEPSFEHGFEVRTAKELADGAGTELLLADVNGDSRADAIVTKHTSKGISSAKTSVSVFYGAAAGFPAKADQLIETEGAAAASMQLGDVTGDGRLDLLVPSVQLGLFSIIRVLTSSSMKVDFHLHAMQPSGAFSPKPVASRDLVFQLSLNENQSDMQAVDMTGDYDGDGKVDLAFGVGKDELALYSGGHADRIFSSEPMATLKVRAFGHPLPVSLDGGPRTDLVLWYPETRGHQHELALIRRQ